MVDGEKGFKFEERPLSSMPPSERQKVLRDRADRPLENPAIATTDLYDAMPCDDDPEPIQELEIPHLYATIDDGTGLEVRSVATLVVMSDGSVYPTVGDDQMLDEVEGFLGLVHCQDPTKFRSDEAVLEALESTKL